MGGNAQKGLGEQGPIMYRRGKLGNKSRWVEIGSQIVEGSKHNYNKGYSIKNDRIWGRESGKAPQKVCKRKQKGKVQKGWRSRERLGGGDRAKMIGGKIGQKILGHRGFEKKLRVPGKKYLGCKIERMML